MFGPGSKNPGFVCWSYPITLYSPVELDWFIKGLPVIHEHIRCLGSSKRVGGLYILIKQFNHFIKWPRAVIINKNESKLADYFRVQAMNREVKVKELQLLDAARRKFINHQQRQKEVDLKRLDDELERKVRSFYFRPNTIHY
jgi:hypothetical protein